MTENIKGYRYNEHLRTPEAPQGWKGSPVDENGRFLNLDHRFIPNMADALRWKLQKSPFAENKKLEIYQPEIHRDDSWLATNDDVIVWLGHSTFFIRINGVKLLTDPVFFNIFSIKRVSEFPVNILHLTNLDYILLSHDHRDHLDEKSLKIISNQNPEVRYLTGLGMKELVHDFTRSELIQEAGWYQQYKTEDHSINITFVPARHWSKRGLFDTNKRLWGGFVIEAAGKRILFGGDSGYDAHYKQFASLFKSFDYAILGIGAYEPAWFMSPNHQSPKDALRAFVELNAKCFIPMHYGTFDLSDEPLNQPLKDLHEAAKEADLEGKLNVLEIGEALIID